jgi:glucan 1,3-beta-glucosidase
MALRGVNLGGWLVLERWITPSLFTDLKAQDEYSFCIETGDSKFQKLAKHRNEFITKDDFKWLKKNGIDAVRLPIGYWAIADKEPFINCEEWINKAFAWADEYNLKILLDVHAAPGSQNGYLHSGKGGNIKWHKKDNIKQTLNFIEVISKKYGRQKALWGIELLNEPSSKIKTKTLRNFYESGYEIVRKQCKQEVMVVISDAFKPYDWNDFMSEANYKNVVLDTHLYQCFAANDKNLSLTGHLEKIKNEWDELPTKVDKPIVVGEWSLGLDAKTFNGMDTEQKNEALKLYANAQLEAFSKTDGWFFWNYKTENMPGWNFKYCVENNLLK